MKTIALLLMLALAACTDTGAAGTYAGTLTITLPTGTVVTTSLASLVPAQFELNSTGSGPAVSCTIQRKAQHGTMLSFDCVTAPCFCSVEPNNLAVTAATGTAVDNVLSLQFSGTVGESDAFSAVFMGTHQ